MFTDSRLGLFAHLCVQIPAEIRSRRDQELRDVRLKWIQTIDQDTEASRQKAAEEQAIRDDQDKLNSEVRVR